MKKLLPFLALLFLSSTSFANDEKVVPSKIDNVTVYSQGAQIHRKANYSIGRGITEVIIDGVSQNIDANSLQVSATGKAIILDSKYSIFYPEKSAAVLSAESMKIKKKIDLLRDSIQVVKYELQSIQDEINVYEETKKILANNGAIKGHGKVNDSIALLKDAIEYYTEKMMVINKKIQVLKRDKNKVIIQRKGMNARLIELNNQLNNNGGNVKPLKPTYRITITFKSDAAVSGKINVSYLVSNAGWTPLYDLRSESSSNTINLNYKAKVHQNTGIDWKDVRLNISTNNPYQNKTKPTLHPWYVDFNNYRALNNRADKYERNATAPVPVTAAYDAVSELEETTMDAAGASDFTNIVQNMISVEFRIDLPYTIESNGQEHMVLVKNVDLDTKYKYYTVPKYDKGVYLVAELYKLDELQLVPASANIFFDGTYMGKTYIDPTTMDDTLSLSLGKDPNIIVRRTLLKKESKQKIVGSKIERTFAYAIEVKNLKGRTIELVVQDQMPITQNGDIEIELLESSKGKVNERTGLIEWTFNLKPKGDKDIQFSYKVRYDKDKKLYLQ